MVITEAFDKLFREAKGRIIIGTFASLISRIQQVADTAQKYGRKLAITGRSMRDNTKMARRLGYLDIPDDMIVELDQAVNMPDHQVTIMATGTQGEPMAVMSRLSRGRHRGLSIKKGIPSSFRPIPFPATKRWSTALSTCCCSVGPTFYTNGLPTYTSPAMPARKR
jgi:ribonuclease J